VAQRQAVGYGAFVQMDEVTLLSRSPELFFSIDRDRNVETMPMKGTAPRGVTDVEDKALAAELAADAKNRAENLMIVDLLRNDLARVSEVGSVRVPDLFQMQSFATVHQMVSRITSRLRPDVSLLDLFEGLFPCGSITGAPKIAAMQAIRRLEPGPRDAYCGAIGWLAPDGRALFNVAIRTLCLYENDEVVLNVGGGVVADSRADAEYEEALWKARFATSILKD
jgi:para-aminobenzoate synthetase component 1